MNSVTITVLAAGPDLPGGNRFGALVLAVVAAGGAAVPWLLDVVGRRRRWRSSEYQRELVLGAPHRRTPEDVLRSMHDLRRQDFEYVVMSRSRRNRGAAIAGIAAGLLVLTGLGLAVAGALASGIAIALMGSVPGAVAKMYYSRAEQADAEVRTVRREIERVILLETMESGPARDALIADLVRGAAGVTTSSSIHVEAPALPARSDDPA
ncbi:hypothetical protein [Amycolatopsis sp. NPDC051102]|uniref:hypothetical protein n=1 Tax=Amycolatopsis sp. NPDC051102 TaxID=3155163 RepID=UPI0034486E3A